MTRAKVHLIAGVLALPFMAAAHDIPNDVTVQLFVKPEGTHLNLLLRVPLAAMRDVNFPTTGPGYLDVSRMGPVLDEAATVWIVNALDVYEDAAALPKPHVSETRISLPSDRSFATYASALAHITSRPSASDNSLYWNQAMFDIRLEYPIHSDRARFSIHPGLGRLGLRVVTALRFVPPGGTVRAFEFEGDPGIVHLDPTWHQSAVDSFVLDFSISSTAPITCCFCSAW